MVLSVSPRRWNGANTRSISVGGMPGPRSMTRSSTRSPRLLPVTTGGCPGGLYRSALPTRFARTRSSRPGSASTTGRSSGTSTTTGRPAAPRSSRASGTTSSRASGRLTTDSIAGLQPAHVQQVVHQAGEPVQGLVGGEQQLVVVLRRPLDVVAAEAGHRRLRGRQRGAQVVPDGREQCGAHPVALGDGDRGGGRLAQPVPLQDHRGLRGERPDHPLVLGAQRPTPQRRASRCPRPAPRCRRPAGARTGRCPRWPRPSTGRRARVRQRRGLESAAGSAPAA